MAGSQRTSKVIVGTLACWFVLTHDLHLIVKDGCPGSWHSSSCQEEKGNRFAWPSLSRHKLEVVHIISSHIPLDRLSHVLVHSHTAARKPGELVSFFMAKEPDKPQGFLCL